MEVLVFIYKGPRCRAISLQGEGQTSLFPQFCPKPASVVPPELRVIEKTLGVRRPRSLESNLISVLSGPFYQVRTSDQMCSMDGEENRMLLILGEELYYLENPSKYAHGPPLV